MNMYEDEDYDFANQETIINREHYCPRCAGHGCNYCLMLEY